MKIFKLKINFKALALVMAIGAAFAFTDRGDQPDPNKQLFGLDDQGQWVPATETHFCSGPLTQTCVAQFEDDDPSKPMTYEVKGIYNP